MALAQNGLGAYGYIMELALCIITGVGLSAACGFRVFVPMLIMSLAAHAGHLNLAPGFAWIGSTPALIAFAIATALEIGGYYVPAVDNILDSIATPAAVVAGIVVMASLVTDVSPFFKWSMAVVAGGGAAGIVQAGTVIARGKSTVGTLGMANPILATIELGGAFVTSVVSILMPLALIVLLLGGVGIFVWWLRRRRVAVRAVEAPAAVSEVSRS